MQPTPPKSFVFPQSEMSLPGGHLEIRLASVKDVQRLLRESSVDNTAGFLPRVVDAKEYTELALRRWTEALNKERTISQVDHFVEFINDNPFAEVAALALATSNTQVLGLCYFRRTWCNNLCIEFLTRLPKYALNCPLKGIGTALLFYVCEVAKSLSAGEIWAEATQTSVIFYRDGFNNPNFMDLMRIGPSDYQQFAEVFRNGLSN